jgi:hypothetical protein
MGWEMYCFKLKFCRRKYRPGDVPLVSCVAQRSFLFSISVSRNSCAQGPFVENIYACRTNPVCFGLQSVLNLSTCDSIAPIYIVTIKILFVCSRFVTRLPRPMTIWKITHYWSVVKCVRFSGNRGTCLDRKTRTSVRKLNLAVQLCSTFSSRAAVDNFFFFFHNF